MTIALNDVLQISNLSIDGDMIVGSFDMLNEEVVTLVHKCLGVESSIIKQEF